MMELVDMRDLGSRAAMRWGSSPHARTRNSPRLWTPLHSQGLFSLHLIVPAQTQQKSAYCGEFFQNQPLFSVCRTGKKSDRPSGRSLCRAYVRLLSGADSAVGAGIAARTAVQAGTGVDHVTIITLGNRTHGTCVCASAAADASGTDLIGHVVAPPFLICKPIVS